MKADYDVGLFSSELIDSILSKRGYTEKYISSLYSIVDIANPKIKYFDKAYNLLIESILADKPILVFFDVDLDGLVSGHEISTLVTELGGKVENYINNQKVHGITDELVDYCITNKIGLFIAVDSSINATEHLNRLVENNTKVIVLDHHIIEETTDTTPTPSKVLCNCLNLEPEETRDFTKISAGVLCYYFREYCRHQLGKPEDSMLDTFDLAAITIYSDFCDLSNEVNRNIAYNLFTRESYCTKILHFLNTDQNLKEVSNDLKTSKLRGKFNLTSTLLAFKLVPTYNAMIRTGNTRKALEMITTDRNEVYLDLVNFGEKCIEEQKKLIKKLIETGEAYDLGNFEIINIQKADLGDKNNLKPNFTGLLASKVRTMHGKPCITLYSDKATSCLKGSFRGLSSLNYKQLLANSGATALGHEMACGVSIPAKEFGKVVANIQNNFPKVSPEAEYDIELESRGLVKYSKDLLSIAYFNEFAGAGLFKIKIKLVPSAKPVLRGISERLTIIECDKVDILYFGTEKEAEKSIERNIVVVPTLEIKSNLVTYSLINES